MHPSLIAFKNDVLERIQPFQSDRDFAELVTALISDLNDLSPARQDYMVVLRRMFDRLNEPRIANGLAPLDTRPTSEAYDTLAPSAMAIADLATLVEILRGQVFVYTATGVNLDNLGRDFNFPRFRATQARRRGETFNNRMELADFPIGSRFHPRVLVPNAGTSNIAFLIESTENGEVIFVCESPGTIGNQFFGDLVGKNVNGLGRAIITDELGACRPGQDSETDEQYRSRFLQFLRRKAFGGNVAQYQQEIQQIDGVGQLMIFPCWRNAWTTKVSIADSQNKPVGSDFIETVQNLVDPIPRGGTGFGFAPVGHRVTISTSEYLEINITIPVIPVLGATIGQIYPVAREIIDGYFDELTRGAREAQGVFDQWERTYFSSEGIAITSATLSANIEALNTFFIANQNIVTGDIAIAYQNMRTLLEWFPTEHVKQSHNFEVLLQSQEMGVRLQRHELIRNVDFTGIMINGANHIQGFPIESNEEVQRLPKLIYLELIDISGV
ncbi:MAG: baseplate J/gp47 family protein [Defluviitaleaceae bacterium]|nr:baseplate J/gp47 family protein [Defluviitaleaceae bacterium]